MFRSLFSSVLLVATLAPGAAYCVVQQKAFAQGLVPGGALVVDMGSNVRISRDDCQRLTRHEPSADVAYQPGRDVRGRAVAPAELGGSSGFRMPDEISIAIGFDLRKKFGLPGAGNPNLYTGDATVGTVTVDQQERARFNGQPLSAIEQEEIAHACYKRGGG